MVACTKSTSSNHQNDGGKVDTAQIDMINLNDSTLLSDEKLDDQHGKIKKPPKTGLDSLPFLGGMNISSGFYSIWDSVAFDWDFNEDGIMDSLYGSWEGGSGFGGRVIKIVNGATKESFEVYAYGSKFTENKWIPAQPELFDKKNTSFRKVIEYYLEFGIAQRNFYDPKQLKKWKGENSTYLDVKTDLLLRSLEQSYAPWNQGGFTRTSHSFFRLYPNWNKEKEDWNKYETWDEDEEEIGLKCGWVQFASFGWQLLKGTGTKRKRFYTSNSMLLVVEKSRYKLLRIPISPGRFSGVSSVSYAPKHEVMFIAGYNYGEPELYAIDVESSRMGRINQRSLERIPNPELDISETTLELDSGWVCFGGERGRIDSIKLHLNGVYESL